MDWLHLVKQRDKAEDSLSRPVEFSWEGGCAPYHFVLSCEYGVICADCREPGITVDNLYVGTDYTWTVTDGKAMAAASARVGSIGVRNLTAIWM